MGVHQPGFSRNAVRWLIRTGVLAKTGALGTDTFGPDPSSDAAFLPTWLTLRRHRLTIENLTNLDALPPVGCVGRAWEPTQRQRFGGAGDGVRVGPERVTGRAIAGSDEAEHADRPQSVQVPEGHGRRRYVDPRPRLLLRSEASALGAFRWSTYSASRCRRSVSRAIRAAFPAIFCTTV